MVRLFPDGTDNDGGDTEWDDDSGAQCDNCGWSGRVNQLKMADYFEQEEVEIEEEEG